MRSIYSSDKVQSLRTAIAQMQFIEANVDAFRSVANPKDIKAYREFKNLLDSKYALTDKQLSYVDVLYEKTMKGLGLPSYSSTYKSRIKY